MAFTAWRQAEPVKIEPGKGFITRGYQIYRGFKEGGKGGGELPYNDEGFIEPEAEQEPPRTMIQQATGAGSQLNPQALGQKQKPEAEPEQPFELTLPKGDKINFPNLESFLAGLREIKGNYPHLAGQIEELEKQHGG